MQGVPPGGVSVTCCRSSKSPLKVAGRPPPPLEVPAGDGGGGGLSPSSEEGSLDVQGPVAGFSAEPVWERGMAEEVGWGSGQQSGGRGEDHGEDVGPGSQRMLDRK